MILISYPSGGFGNFIYHVLTEFASNTYKPDNINFKFDTLGRSHETIKYTTTYFHDPENYSIQLPDTDKECIILCDNGIQNDSYDKIDLTFPQAIKVRMCIDDDIRPVIYKTCINKALESDVFNETRSHIIKNWEDSNEDYTVRENFTLFYHNWPFKWEPDLDCINVSIKSLISRPEATIIDLITKLNGKVINYDKLTEISHEWFKTNYTYFKIFYQWQEIEKALTADVNFNISDITDLHDQGYINYRIERMYNVVIPVYDYRNWYLSTNDIKEMVKCLK